MRRLRSTIVLAALAVAGMLATTMGPASAGPSTATAPNLQQQIDQQLRAKPGGVQISANEIAWNNGTVVMTFPSAGAVTTLGTANCSSNWFCFWENASFEGRKLSFSSCGKQDLSGWDFRNKVTSWHNNSGSKIEVWQDDVLDDLLWTESAYSSSSNVGSADNDRADYFKRIC